MNRDHDDDDEPDVKVDNEVSDDYDSNPAEKETRDSRAPARLEKDVFDEDDDDVRGANKDDQPANVTDLNSIRLPRDTLIKWLSKPFFNTFVPGFFVRISIGPDPLTHLSVYRVAEIAEVREGKATYSLPGLEGQTNKLLRLRIAGKDKDCKMETISNKSFSETEFKKWVSEMSKAHLHILTVKETREKQKQLSIAHDYKYTSEDIESMLKEKRKEGKLPVKLAAEKARLTALRDAARDTDPDEYDRLSEELIRLEQLWRQKCERTTGEGTPAALIANINLKNKQKNFDKSIAETVKEVKANNDLDPFSRRKTLPRVMLARSKKNTEGVEVKAEDFEEKKPEPSNSHSSNNNNDNNNSNHNNKSDVLKRSLGASTDKVQSGKGVQDEHSGIDLDIPVDILSSSTGLQQIPKQLATPVAPLPLPTSLPSTSYVSPASTASASASKLSLADYMRRRRDAMA
jgi:RNA polymerase-associated protein RTF1